MIDFEFAFLQPKSMEEAINVFQSHRKKDKKVMYYSGGTEFISRARMREIKPDVVISLKGIPECHTYHMKKGELIIGAMTSLNQLIDVPLFPLLAEVSRAIATHTERNKITIGGNLCSNLPYKEALLPFLLADSDVLIATKKGPVKRSIHDLSQLKGAEFLVRIITDAKFVDAPFMNQKKTKHSNVNYPVLTMASLQLEKESRFAISGLCKQPFRSEKVEKIIHEQKDQPNACVQSVLDATPGAILDDLQASKEYRLFVFTTMLQQFLDRREKLA